MPSYLELFNKKKRTIIFNTRKHEEDETLFFYKVSKDSDLIQQLVSALYKLNIQSVLVEGGAKLLELFIKKGIWDEVRIIRNEKLIIENGINAPELPRAIVNKKEAILNDSISVYLPE